MSESKLSQTKIKKFRQTVYQYYKENERHTLPWRRTRDPYRILLSEFMLQQTQVDRVLPKYKSWTEIFRTLPVWHTLL